MTPSPSSLEQDIILFQDWTMCRLTGENGNPMNMEEKRHYATCLVVALSPSSVTVPFPTRVHRGDALCLMEENLEPGRTLGARRIHPQSTSMRVAEEWINTCSKLHGEACAPVLTEELFGIRLIDVEARKVVPYPNKNIDYVALSYVWGSTKPGAFTENLDRELPKTLEDAFKCTKALRKRYLWIDSLCIDQGNTDDKSDQIGRMWSIYRGAYVTLIALAGDSSDSGLSKTDPSLSRVDNQITCCIDGKRLAGVMPTLSQQMWVAAWGQRAWTLQEAHLSPRCLFLSDHGAYWDCNGMQCSEGLEQAQSWAHNISWKENNTDIPFATWMAQYVGTGAYRSSHYSDRFFNWGSMLALYSYRSMTYSEDAIRAFSAVQQRMQATLYPKGFFWGLPIEDLDWAMVWRSQWPPTIRKGFPSWSWAGWKGGLWAGDFMVASRDQRVPMDLEISCCKDGKLYQLFQSISTNNNGRDNCSIMTRDEPIHRAAACIPRGTDFDLDLCPEAETRGYLFIDAVCLQFAPQFDQHTGRLGVSGQYVEFVSEIRGTQCSLMIQSTDLEVFRQVWRPAERTFIVMARHRTQSSTIVHHLLLVEDQRYTNVMQRGTVLELRIPVDSLHVLEECKPQRQRIVLG